MKRHCSALLMSVWWGPQANWQRSEVYIKRKIEFDHSLWSQKPLNYYSGLSSHLVIVKTVRKTTCELPLKCERIIHERKVALYNRTLDGVEQRIWHTQKKKNAQLSLKYDTLTQSLCKQTFRTPAAFLSITQHHFEVSFPLNQITPSWEALALAFIKLH